MHGVRKASVETAHMAEVEDKGAAGGTADRAHTHHGKLLQPAGPNPAAPSFPAENTAQCELPGMPDHTDVLPAVAGDHDLSVTKARRPEAYAIARRHLNAGLSLNAVSDLCGMSKHTVMAIAEELGSEKGLTHDEVGRIVFLREARRGSVLGAAAIAKELADDNPDVPLRDKALATKILSEASEAIGALLPTAGERSVGLRVEDVLAELERGGMG